jgi:uncharacterized protein
MAKSVFDDPQKTLYPKLPKINDLAPGKDRGLVSTKLQVFKADDPIGPKLHWDPIHRIDQDPWKDFREIMRVEWKMEITYRHSLGKYSKFFIELENKKFYATECPKCGFVYAIPRPVCPDCLAITKWKELPGTGTLASYSISEFVPAFMKVEMPYVLSMVKLDGADSLFTHQLRNWGTDRTKIKTGMPVKVAYTKEPVVHPMLLMWFEPA